MKRAHLRALVMTIVLTMTSGGAEAHTTLASSTPASGSILTASPPSITLNFRAPVRLTALTVVSAAAERRLAFEPVGKAKAFTSKAPALAAGRNEIRWRALSQDGHVVDGSLILVVRPAGP